MLASQAFSKPTLHVIFVAIIEHVHRRVWDCSLHSVYDRAAFSKAPQFNTMWKFHIFWFLNSDFDCLELA